MERGADLEAKTKDGLAPLHCAARSGHEPVVQLILQKTDTTEISRTKVIQRAVYLHQFNCWKTVISQFQPTYRN